MDRRLTAGAERFLYRCGSGILLNRKSDRRRHAPACPEDSLHPDLIRLLGDGEPGHDRRASA